MQREWLDETSKYILEPYNNSRRSEYHGYHHGRFKGGSEGAAAPSKKSAPLWPPNEVYDKA